MRGFWRRAATWRAARPISRHGPECRRVTACCRKATTCAKAAPDRITNELRPEFVDSCLNLFLLDPDDRYRELARVHFEKMKETSRAPYGFTILDDITARPVKQGDLCPGYWWSEQMKYYWLLFSNTDRFDYKTNYLSTEGNVLVGLK